MVMMILAGLWAVGHVNPQLDPAISPPFAFVEVAWPVKVEPAGDVA